jgi:diacylglycerol kinase
MTTTDVEKPARMLIWRFVLLATLVAATGAGVVAGFSGDEVVSAADHAARGPDYAMGREAMFAFAVPAAAALLVWLAFFLLVFNRRAPFWKSIVALLIIWLVTTVVATPLRLYSFTTHVAADDEAVNAQYARTRERVNVLRSEVFTEEGLVRMPMGGPAMLRSPADLDPRIAGIEEGRARFSAYRRDVQAMLAEARTELEQMDVFYAVKEDGLERYDRTLRDHVTRHLELMELDFEKQIEALQFLRSHRAAWTVQDGVIAFYDRRVMQQFGALMDERQRISSELDRLDGALGNVALPTAEPAQAN